MKDSAHFPELLNGGWMSLSFQPFRPGIEIAWLQEGTPGIAILRYAPGAQVPLHRHPDIEMILVLEGAQSDERGTYRAGDIVLNLPGSTHQVQSPDGCVVLLMWSKPVEILGNATDP